MTMTASDAPFLTAVTGGQPAHTPVWFMRQAGRSLPEYRALRAHHSMMESCFDPELLAEITLQPVRRHNVDAAILFSDIVVPLKAAGIGVDIVPGKGPVVTCPVRTAKDIDRLPVLDQEVDEVSQGIRLINDELDARTALIGFIGAPLTLASYLIEGGPSKNHHRTKAMMKSDPSTFEHLMAKITDTVICFLRTQIAAGIDCMQLFDSWAGMATKADYERHILPHSTRIIDAVKDEIPTIHFGVQTGELLGAMAKAGSSVMGVDWRTPLDTAARRMYDETKTARVIQGNLDPAMLFAGDDVLADEITRIKGEARRAISEGTATAHVFNLGHGVIPDTDPDVLTRAVELIHHN